MKVSIFFPLRKKPSEQVGKKQLAVGKGCHDRIVRKQEVYKDLLEWSEEVESLLNHMVENPEKYILRHCQLPFANCQLDFSTTCW